VKEIICELKEINKIYQGRNVLNNINIKLQKGETYGFIGKNGAGKTTTMRIIVGLSLQTNGEIYLEGVKESHLLSEKRKKIGCMIENPALYMGMSAIENLEAIRILYGILDKKRSSQILRMVGLENTGSKAAKNFSLGMRQRLGIGMALMNNPQLLILDEPINGLDPDGIVEVRELIKGINKKHGTTILISSHILSEMYQTVDNYILIDKGRIVEEISHQELNKNCQKYILIKSDNVSTLIDTIRGKLNTENFRVMENNSIRMYDYTDDLLKVLSVLGSVGIDSKDISVMEDSLEEYFFKRTSCREES